MFDIAKQFNPVKISLCTSLYCTENMESGYCPECSHAIYKGEGKDINGKVWRWEFNSYFGPLFLRKDGDQMFNQPTKENHPVWPVFERWYKTARYIGVI